MKRYRIICLSIFLFCIHFNVAIALIVHDPAQTAQMVASFAKQATALSKQMNELVRQTQMLQTQISNQQQMITSQDRMTKGLTASEWDSFADNFKQLNQAVQQGNGISYAMSDLNERFKLQYPGYKAPDDYPTAYSGWSQNTLSSINGALASANLQSNEFATENARMSVLSRLSDNATGQTQAIQAGNMIANNLVVQMQKLRQLQMAQMQAQDAYMAHEVNKEAANRAMMKQIFHEIIPPGNNTGF